jgi:hypothetical protein
MASMSFWRLLSDCYKILNEMSTIMRLKTHRLFKPVVWLQRSESLGNRVRVEAFLVARRVGLKLAHQKDGSV